MPRAMFYILRREISGPVGIPGTPDYRLFGGDSDTLRASLIVQLVKNRLQCRRPPFDSWVGKIPWRRDRLPTPEFLGFPRGSAGKESAFNAGDLGSIPGLFNYYFCLILTTIRNFKDKDEKVAIQLFNL